MAAAEHPRHHRSSSSVRHHHGMFTTGFDVITSSRKYGEGIGNYTLTDHVSLVVTYSATSRT